MAANLTDILEKIIFDEDIYKLFYEIEMPLVFVLDEMNREGILIDKKSLKITVNL